MATTGGGGTSASTAIIKVTPISGSRQECAPACYLLEIDQAKILLDAGTTSCFNCDHLNTLRRITKSIDLVLLSHGDLRHCGALPRLLATFQINGPVLATVPVHHMGLVTLYDAYEAHYQVDGQPPPGDMTLDHVDAAFERITMLRYSQSYTCTAGPAMGIQLTPLAAGHTLGGAIWRIRKHSEEIFYMMDFNHKREAHLDGASLEVIQRPTLLIADSKGALEVHATRKQRDTELLDSLLGPLRAGGSVLVPVETAGRVLELLQVIDAHWASHRLPFPVIFLSHQSRRVLDLSKGMLEWMSQSLTRVFEQDRTNPFDLRSVRACHSMLELEAISGPKVILATFSSLDTGFGRSCLASVLASSASAIILATKTEPDAMAAKILALAKGSRATISFAKKVPLEGDELERHLQEERDSSERRAAEVAFAKLQREREEEEDAEEEGEEGEEEGEEAGGERSGGGRGRATEGGAEMGAEAAESKRLEQEQINSAAALRNFYWTDYRKDWFIEPDSIIAKLARESANSPYYPMIPPEAQANAEGGGMPIRHQAFPFRERRRLIDAYGEVVDPLEFKPKGTLSGLAAEATTSGPRTIQTIAPLMADANDSSSSGGGAALPPSKWATISQEVTSKAAKKFIDVSGISDGRSLKTIYSRIQPRRIVFVGGSGDATDFLVNHFLQSAAQAGRTSMEVFSPHLGETVTVCSAVNVMQVTLAESLISKLQLQLLGDYELTWVRGAVRLEADVPMQIDTAEAPQEMMLVDSLGTDGSARGGERSPLEEGEVVVRSDSKPRIFLTEPPEAETAAVASPGTNATTLMLGDPKLSEIRRILQSQLNIPATFISGELVCGAGERRVMIRREADEARFSIEGPLCEEYYAVREALYALTTLVQ